MNPAIGAEAVDAAFAEFGIAGCTYTPPSGPAVAGIVLMLLGPDAEAAFGDTRAAVATGRIDVRASEVAAPVRDGVFRIGDNNYRITAKPTTGDPSRLVWRCPVHAI